MQLPDMPREHASHEASVPCSTLFFNTTSHSKASLAWDLRNFRHCFCSEYVIDEKPLSGLSVSIICLAL
jgi:hypothetical protein